MLEILERTRNRNNRSNFIELFVTFLTEDPCITKFIPHFGHFSGFSRFTSGRIGQIYTFIILFHPHDEVMDYTNEAQ